ncbi:beta-galactosidase [Caulobacter segnis]
MATSALADPVRYTMTAFTNASQSNMSVYDSADGTRFTLKKPLAYTPPQGLIRDPSVMKHADGWYYVAYTTGWTGDTIGLARSKNLTDWTFLRDVKIDVPGGATSSWDAGVVRRPGRRDQPDPVGLDHRHRRPVPGLPDHRRRRLADKLEQAQGPVGPGPELHRHLRRAPGRPLPGLRQERDDQVHRAVDRSSLDGPWQLKGAGDWAGWGRGVEGPAMVRTADGGWRIYFDEYSAKRYWYSDSKDGFRTWTPKAELPSCRRGAPLHGAEGRRRRASDQARRSSRDHLGQVLAEGRRPAGVLVGRRVHPFRAPSPDLWRDILQKMKASGHNTVAIYFDWGYHSPKQESTISAACATWTAC